MIPLRTLHLLQAGLKQLFDIDPSLTEHFLRNTLIQSMAISVVASEVIRNYSDKFADVISPVMQDLRMIRLGSPEL